MGHSPDLDTLNGNEIAVIGLSCRFPGAQDVAAYLHNLRNGVESISFLNEAALEASVIDHTTDPSHPDHVRAASLIDGADLFDAQFFGYSPKDAALIDPQQRLFLEHAWMALESAGCDPERYPHSIGVFAGARTNTYVYNLLANRAAVGNLTALELSPSNDFASLSTRVAYKLNLRGPAYSIHTACSTGLAAVHLACQSVLIGESRMAIAGAVALNVPQQTGYLYREGGIASPDGHTRSFDDSAGGTLFGSGVGVVVLKRLDDALHDGDTIHAVIKGSAANNDGSAKASYTAPSVDGQAAVIREALTVAGVEPETISYVEAHGTGTRLGDAIEIRALTKAFRSGATRPGSYAIGTAKTNFGHLESAAGVAGLIKAILALKHKQIPPSLHFTRPNPDLQLEQTPFYVNTTLADWPSPQGPRRAGVSSFGIGGTNIHLILEEAPAQRSAESARPWQLLPVSAKSAAALDQATANLATYIEQHPELPLADVAHTLQVGRAVFDHRRVAVCRDRHHAVAVLRGEDPNQLFSGAPQPGLPSFSFMFAGQGSQHVDMGRDLYRDEPVFRAQVDHCSERLGPHLGIDLRQLLYPAAGQTVEAAERITQTAIAQPALFVIEYALAQLLLDRGIRPQSLIGHSIGEYVAACLAGVFTLDDALALVAQRGKLMQSLPAGAMLAVSLPETELRPRMAATLDLAAVNAPRMCVVAGPSAEIQAFAERLAQDEVETRSLQTSHAFHSRGMDPILTAFERTLATMTLRPPQTPFLSNVTGTWIRDEEATDPRYWSRHLRSTVRFADGLKTLTATPNAVLLDVGPGRTLGRLAQANATRESPPLVLSLLPPAKADQSDRASFLATLGRLWLAGCEVNWQRGHAGEQRLRVDLPPYPFERQRYWIDPLPTPAASAQPASARVTGERLPMADWFYAPSWRRTAVTPTADWAQRQTWLVLAPDNDGFSDLLIAALREAGQTVLVVSPGERYVRVDDSRFTLRPESREDFITLASELKAEQRVPHAVLHLWTLSYQPVSPLTVAAFDSAQAVGFHSLLAVAQAFGTAPLKLAVVSQELHEVLGDERPRPELSTLLGACKVIAQEYPHTTGQNIDLVIPDAAGPQHELIRKVMDELRNGSAPVVALRGRHRWAQDVTRLAREPSVKPRLRQSGVYLVTGGLDPVGFTIAEWLVRSSGARLILLESQSLPPRETWDEQLETDDRENETAARIANVRALEAAGAELLLLSADFGDRAALQAAVDHGAARFGEIHGVIHAASVPGGELIALRAKDAIEQVFAAKAKGLIHLHSILREVPLDFFVLCSSINAVLGEVGQVDPCAANGFLGMYAQATALTSSTPLTAIHWDLWKASSKQIQRLLRKAGLPPTTAERLEREIERGLSAEEGIATFERAVAGVAAEVTISTQSLDERIERVQALKVELSRAAAGASLVKQYRRPNLQTAYVAPRNEEEQIVAAIWQDALGIDQIGIHDDFFELGGHSLLVTMMISRLRDALGVDIPIGRLFHKPTIAGLMETKAELQTEQGGDVAEILDLLAKLSDEDAEEELLRRAGGSHA